MPGREISENTRTWLQGELQVWRDVGVLAEDQPARILALYETAHDTARRRRSVAVFTLMALAGLLVGLAVLLLIGYNWQAMPRLVKVALIFLAIVGTYAAGFWTRYIRQARLASEILFFLGCLFYGGGIWLLAQVFHIQSHWPNGLWIWAVGVLPLALCLDTLLLHALVVALSAAWVGAEIIGFPGLGAWLFGRWGFFPNGAYTLPLLALPGLLWAYRKRSVVAISLYVPLLAWWIVLQPVAWHWHEETVYFIGAAGALLLLTAEAHRLGNPLAIPFRLYGVLLAAGVLVPLSFADFQREVMCYHWNQSAAIVTPLAILVAGGAAFALAAYVRRRLDQRSTSIADEVVAIAARQWVPLALLGLMAGLGIWQGLFHIDPGVRRPFGHDLMDRWTFQVVVPAIAANVAMIVLAIWLMRVGLRENRGLPFAAGVLYFLLWAVLRYIDLFGNAGGMLGAAVMFLLCGVGLYLVARFWQDRKEVERV